MGASSSQQEATGADGAGNVAASTGNSSTSIADGGYPSANSGSGAAASSATPAHNSSTPLNSVATAGQGIEDTTDDEAIARALAAQEQARHARRGVGGNMSAGPQHIGMVSLAWRRA